MELAELVEVGDHPALNFLNSTAMEAPDTVEMICDGRAYLSWLQSAGLFSAADTAAALSAFSLDELGAVADEAIRFREWLRAVVADWVDSDDPAPSAAVREQLNRFLAAGRHFMWIGPGDSPAVLQRQHLDQPRQLLVPPAEAAALLLTAGDRRLVRHCEGPGCTLWFYDLTKSHRRRWCSMAACGNREKARKYRQRDRPHTG